MMEKDRADTGVLRYRAVRCAALAVTMVFGAAQGQTITKCQDADGNWHYGDFAAEACARDSNVTEIDERGIKIREKDAPPTQEELDAQESTEQRRQREAETKARQEKENQRLLRTYDSAAAILKARDERVMALDRELESHELFRQDLVDEKQQLEESGENGEQISNVDSQILQYDEAIKSLQDERRTTIEEYNAELEKYRELTGE